MKLILARHGHTYENNKKVISGHTRTRLTPNGIKQAQLLAKRLKNEKIDAIYSSDLIRAVQTAKEIIKYHPNLKLHKLKEFRERNMGSINQKKYYLVDYNNLPKDIEKISLVRKRAISTIKQMQKKHKNKNVLLIGHGGINKMFLTYVMKKPVEHFRKMPWFPNTSITIIDFSKKQPKIKLFNCTKHLGKTIEKNKPEQIIREVRKHFN